VGRCSSRESWLSTSKPTIEQALIAKAVRADSLVPAAGAAAGLPAVALAEVGVRAALAALRDFVIERLVGRPLERLHGHVWL
jgi:hypothetical protein